MRFEVVMAITILLPYCFITWAVYFLSRNPADSQRRVWYDLIKSAFWPVGVIMVVEAVVAYVLRIRPVLSKRQPDRAPPCVNA